MSRAAVYRHFRAALAGIGIDRGKMAGRGLTPLRS